MHRLHVVIKFHALDDGPLETSTTGVFPNEDQVLYTRAFIFDEKHGITFLGVLIVPGYWSVKL